MKLIVADDFFSDFERIENEFKKIKLHNIENFNKLSGDKQNWPGLRSLRLDQESPFLFNLTVKELNEKLQFGKLMGNKKFNFFLHTHLRLNEDQDWIHKDHSYCSIIVYLNTNLDSGTAFFHEETNEPNMIVNAVKNRCILFDSSVRHKSLKNYGNDLNDGRLTLNGFFFLNG
jgi:Rps23 Pro-64 3,4-dihydroxylase Tpa1-like proline 4-hydroxylase